LFRTARLADDGYVVAWDGGKIEMSADNETLARETMSSQDFANFLARNRLTQAAAAFLLGRSRRQIGYYLNAGPVPRIVAACHGFEALRRAKELEQAELRLRDLSRFNNFGCTLGGPWAKLASRRSSSTRTSALSSSKSAWAENSKRNQADGTRTKPFSKAMFLQSRCWVLTHVPAAPRPIPLAIQHYFPTE
jgi:hypothetical protein